MKIIGDCGSKVHAPEGARTACLSAYVAGADAVRLPVRLTKDGYPVVAEDDTTDRLTGTAGKVADLTLKELRALDFGKNFKEADGSPFVYPSRIETFASLLDVLPPELSLLVELKTDADPARRGELVKQVVGAARNRNLTGSMIVTSADEQALTLVRDQPGGVAVGSYRPDLAPDQRLAAALQIRADALVTDAASLVVGNVLTQTAKDAAQQFAAGKLRLGVAALASGSFAPEQFRALNGEAFAWGLSAGSMLEAAATFRPGWKWIDEKWAQKAADHADVNADLWRLGYAKHNEPPYAHVYVDDGIHIELTPFVGDVGFRPTGDAVTDRLNELLERSWYALKDWPFYSGGGVGFAPGILGDFSAEVDVSSVVAAQATTVEMAAVNVDPATNRKPWVQNAQGRWVPNYTTSTRDRHTFFDPHGAPPYVGVEHDEDDGWRINWNLGTDYESNQYGKAFGDGTALTGRIRLDRRGPYFAAYYRATGKSRPLDWVCVGAVRNDSLNPRVFLRLVGKRWRQENAAKPDEWMPVLANHFTFRNMTITRIV